MFVRVPRTTSAAGRIPRAMAFMLSAVLGSTCVVTDSWSVRAQTETPSSQVLPPVGERLEREIEAGQTHVYTLDVPAEHFVDVRIEQLGVDVAVDILDPLGTKLFTADSPSGPSGVEYATFVGAAAGRHTFEVSVFECTSSRQGKYTVEVKALRTATDGDRAVSEATRADADALAEWNKFTDEGLEAALAKYTTAREAWTGLGDTARAADSLHKIGGVMLAKGDLQGAFDTWKAELKIREGLGDRLLQAEILNNLGLLVHDAGNAKEAIGFFEKALPLGEGDLSLQGGSLRGLAQAYSSLGDKKKALATVERALEVLAKSDDRVEEAKAHDLAGDLCRERGRLADASSHLEKALAVWESNCEEIASYAATLVNLGNVATESGNLQEALEYYQRALEKSQEAEDPGVEFRALNGLGAWYERTGRKDDAIVTLTRAIALAKQSGNNRDLGLALLNLGRAHQPFRNLNDQAARSAARRAIGFFTRAGAAYRLAGDVYFEAGSTFAAAQAQFQFLSPVIANRLVRRALVLSKRSGYTKCEASSLILLGRMALRARRWREAGTYFTQALSMTRAAGLRNDEVESLFGLARTESGRGDYSKALEDMESLLVLVEDLRVRISDSDTRRSYFGSIQDYYEFYVELLMRMHAQDPGKGYDRRALEISERSRSRALVDWLVASNAQVLEGVDPDARMRREALLKEIDGRLAALTVRVSPEDAAELRADLDAKARELKLLDDSIRSSTPRYSDLVAPEPVQLATIQSDLIDPDTVLLEYFLGKQKSYVWVVTNEAVVSRELPGKDAIEQTAVAYHALSGTLGSTSKESKGAKSTRQSQGTANERVGARLSRMVLGPVADALSRKRIVVAGHGALQYIPFAALPDPRPGAGKLLVEEHEIVSIPSAAAVLADRKNAHRRSDTASDMVIFADPVFDTSDARVTALAAPTGNGDATASRKVVLDDGVEQAAQDTGVLKPGLKLKRLPGTRREADAIRSIVAPGTGRSLYDFDANRDIAMSGVLANYRVVHFATHGLLNAKNPENSGLVLSRFDEKGAPRDGFLRARDVLNMHLNADLVVLSACETGLGKDVRGEGLVGLSRAFLYAGAPRIVVSLWAVNDAATAELMTRFYRQYYIGKLAPAAALRAAQIELIQETEWKEPCYWAAFVVQGAWE